MNSSVDKRILIVRLPKRTDLRKRIFNPQIGFFDEESLDKYLDLVKELKNEFKDSKVEVFYSDENFHLSKATELLSDSLSARLRVEPGFRSSEVTALIGFGERLHSIYPRHQELKGQILGNRYQDLLQFKDRVKTAVKKMIQTEAEVVIAVAIDKLVIDMIDHLLSNDDFDLENFRASGLDHSVVHECEFRGSR